MGPFPQPRTENTVGEALSIRTSAAAAGIGGMAPYPYLPKSEVWPRIRIAGIGGMAQYPYCRNLLFAEGLVELTWHVRVRGLGLAGKRLRTGLRLPR